MKLSHKAKKITIITSAAAVAVCALTGIIYANTSIGSVAAAPKSSSAATSAATSSAATVSPIQITGTETVSVPSGIAGTGKAWNPSTKKSVSAPLTTTKKPSSTPPKPVIRQDAQSKKVLSDKTRKPAYSTQPQPPASHKSNAGSTNGGSAKKSNTGDNDPIFGDRSKYRTGRGEQTKANDMYEDGTKVGIMD